MGVSFPRTDNQSKSAGKISGDYYSVDKSGTEANANPMRRLLCGKQIRETAVAVYNEAQSPQSEVVHTTR